MEQFCFRQLYFVDLALMFTLMKVLHYVNIVCSVSSLMLEVIIIMITRNAFCGTWYLPHRHVHVHNERTVPIIMAECIALARNGRISTSGEKSDVTIVFPDPDFLKGAKILAIQP